MENYIVINGKKAELTEEQLEKLEKLGIKVEKDIFNPKKGEQYWSIEVGEVLEPYTWCNDFFDRVAKEVGNCCTDRDVMQQRAWHETLNRLLWKFSMQHGGQNLNWGKSNQDKFYICYNYADHKFCVYDRCSIKPYDVYFVSEEIAQEAIDTIVVPFMEQHSDFVW